MGETIPFYDDTAVRGCLRMADLIAAMRGALIEFSAGRVRQPPREFIETRGGWFAAMPASGSALGAKLVSMYPDNAERGLPTHAALIALFDPDTGMPMALMDGTLITEMRTAAVSALAVDALAAPEARTLAILGSGTQARSHVAALSLVRGFDDIRVWSRTPTHAQAFAEAHGARAMTAEDAVRGADVVVTATSARKPVLRGTWLKPGAHVAAVGAVRRTWRELDDVAMANFLVVDSRAAMAGESGDVSLSGATIDAELGEILAGSGVPPPGTTTVFKSVGLAIEDVATARLVHEKLTGAGVPAG